MSEVMANLLNLSFVACKFYANWKLVVVTPVLKIPKPNIFSDFRPILLLQSCHALLKN